MSGPNKQMYAAVHYYDNMRKQPIIYVDCTQIKDFNPNDADLMKKPQFVKRLNLCTGEDEFVPAQVHAIADTMEELQNESKRYTFNKIRVSDATLELRKRFPEESENGSKKGIGKSSSNATNTTKESRKERLIGDKKKSCEDVDLEQKLHALEAMKIQFEADVPQEMKLRNELKVLEMDHSTATKECETRISHYEEIMKKQGEIIKRMEEELSFLRRNYEKVSKITSTSAKRELFNAEGYKEIEPPAKKSKHAVDSETADGSYDMDTCYSSSEPINTPPSKSFVGVEPILEEQLPTESSILEKTSQIEGTSSDSSALEQSDARPPTSEDFTATNTQASTLQQLQVQQSGLSSDASKQDCVIPSAFTADSTPDDELQSPSNSETLDNLQKSIDAKCTVNLPASQKNKRKSKKVHKEKKKRKKSRKDVKSNSEDRAQKKPTTKRKSKKKSKRGRDSDSEYDSDKYNMDNEMKDMEYWTKKTKDENVKMIHLRFGISILSSAWKTIRKQTTPTKFLRKLARTIWGSSNLANRAINVKKCTTQLPKRSPRKPLTPVKKVVLRKLYFSFINDKVSQAEDRN